MRRERDNGWLGAALAAAAFVGCVAAFVFELFSYQHSVVDWARRDLRARTEQAAAHLEEPLRTQDFRRLGEFGAKCEAEGVRLLVSGTSGGRVYDSWGGGERPTFSESRPCGDYVVTMGFPSSRVFAPFRRALVGFALAGLVGIAGVALFFLVTYRQRVRIRELRRLEKFRRDFIADVSHEIKTPLTGIIGAADLMDGGSPLSALIKKECGRLNRLVQSILDLARLERDGETLNRTDTDLAELVREVAARYPCKCEADGSCVVSCDAQLVAQAISNLITNAVRHSGSDEISVTLEHAGREARIAVEDHGIGIPPAEADRVFERFHRVDPARASETGGAGLGLAIVRRIARLHGGEVTLQPAKPHGCRFVFSLNTGV